MTNIYEFLAAHPDYSEQERRDVVKLWREWSELHVNRDDDPQVDQRLMDSLCSGGSLDDE